MAAPKTDIAAQCRAIINEVKNGVFRPVYLLMGDEPYYPEIVCDAVLENCVDEFSKDFNETVCFGADVTPDQVISAARRFPMMADRQLVCVREAQMMKGVEELATYCAEPLDSTVLVILMHKASADKRKSLYKTVQKVGVVVDSPALRDYEVAGWISRYYESRGLSISPEAAALLAESVGTDLGTIVVETDKMLKNLPEGVSAVNVEDVERNVGVSRQYSVFELTKALSFRNAPECLKIAARLGSSAKFAMPMTVSALYTHFSRILRYAALVQKGNVNPESKAAALAGVNPYFYREYDTAVRNYPLQKAMGAMSLLCEYDYLGKGGDGGTTTPDQLLIELVAKILSL